MGQVRILDCFLDRRVCVRGIDVTDELGWCGLDQVDPPPKQLLARFGPPRLGHATPIGAVGHLTYAAKRRTLISSASNPALPATLSCLAWLTPKMSVLRPELLMAALDLPG